MQQVDEDGLVAEHQSGEFAHVGLAVGLDLIGFGQQQQSEGDVQLRREVTTQTDDPAFEQKFIEMKLCDVDSGEFEEKVDLSSVDVSEYRFDFDKIMYIFEKVVVGVEQEEFDEVEAVDEEFVVVGVFEVFLFLEEQFHDAVEETELADDALGHQVDPLLLQMVLEDLVGLVQHVLNYAFQTRFLEGCVVVVDVVHHVNAQGVVQFVDASEEFVGVVAFDWSAVFD